MSLYVIFNFCMKNISLINGSMHWNSQGHGLAFEIELKYRF